MANITITPLYAGLLGLILLVLSVRVVALVRVKGKLSYGDGNRGELTPIVRAQANFTEYVPLILILIAFAEAGGSSDLWIHALGIALVVGRCLHPIGLTNKPGVNPLRFMGTNLTWIALIGASISVLLNQLG